MAAFDKAFEKTAKDNKFHESLAEQQPIQAVVDKDTVRGIDKEETGWFKIKLREVKIADKKTLISVE